MGDSRAAKESMKQRLDLMIEGVKEDLDGFKRKSSTPVEVSDDYLAMYMIGDHHFGMLADSESKVDDDDWDIKIATEILIDATDRLANRVGNAKHRRIA